MRTPLPAAGRSGILALSNGLPFTLNLPFDDAHTGTVNWPHRISDASTTTVSRWFDTSAFTFPAQYTFGYGGRGYLGTKTLDFSLQRNFKTSYQ